MEDQAFQKIVENARGCYQHIGKIYCPLLNSIVAFNGEGFRHLTHNGLGKKRQREDILRRIALLPHAGLVIGSARTISERRIAGRNEYWSIEQGNIVVVLRRVGAGTIHFYSIWNKR